MSSPPPSEASPQGDDPGLVLDGVSASIGRAALLRRASLRVAPGDFVAVMGPNGAGKTTLLRVALGLVAATEGAVRLDGRAVASLAARERAARLAWLPQHLAVSDPIEAEAFVRAGRFRFREGDADARAGALRALTEVGVAHLASRRMTELSGGERQRVAIAALLAQEAPVLVLDEPANFLDPAHQVAMYRLLGRLWKRGLGILGITHDVNLLAFAHAECTERRLQLVGMKAGEVAFAMAHDAPDVAAALGALFDVPMHEGVVGGRRVIVPALGAKETS